MEIRVPRQSPQILAEIVKGDSKHDRKHGYRKMNHVYRYEAILRHNLKDPVAEREPDDVLCDSGYHHDFAGDGLVAVDRVCDGDGRNRGYSEAGEPKSTDDDRRPWPGARVADCAHDVGDDEEADERDQRWQTHFSFADAIILLGLRSGSAAVSHTSEALDTHTERRARQSENGPAVATPITPPTKKAKLV